ncbi:hypothetical protein SOVF_167460 [Spinacia oleracea]|nr:hypothetical protein SOVF_167460 [Spinacia oleracea]
MINLNFKFSLICHYIIFLMELMHVEAITFGNWLYGYDESIVEGVTIGKEYHVVAIDGRELDFANCKFLVVYIILSF